MPEVKGIGRRKTQLLDDLRNRRRFLGTNEGSSRSKKMETTFYQSNTRKKNNHLSEVYGPTNIKK